MQELSNDLGKVVAVLLYEILCSKSQVFFPLLILFMAFFLEGDNQISFTP